jgi:heat shock protein HtpX
VNGKALDLLKAVGIGLVFSSLSAMLVNAFAPALIVPVALVLFFVGLMIGFLFSFEGASFLYGLGLFTVLMMGLGYQLGALSSLTSAWVLAFFLLGIFLGIYMPHTPTFQRGLLSTLAVTSMGLMGAVLGNAAGLALLFAITFLAIGTWVVVRVPEWACIVMASGCVLTIFMMGLGYTVALFLGQEYFWVPLLFAVALIVALYMRPARARLLLLLLAPLDLLIGLGYLVGTAFFILYGAVLFFLVLGLILDFAIYYASDSMILKANAARIMEAEERPVEQALVKAMATAAGLPPPRLALINSEVMNLFAVGRSPSRAVIALTKGALEKMTPEELDALLTHEIFHIKEKDMLPMTIAATVAYPVGRLAKPIIFEKDRSFNPLIWLLIGIIAPFVALLLHMSTPRVRERRADEAVAAAGKAEAMASALEKMDADPGDNALEVNPATEPLFAVNPLRGGGLVELFNTHPPTDERIDELLATVKPKTEPQTGASGAPAGGAATVEWQQAQPAAPAATAAAKPAGPAPAPSAAQPSPEPKMPEGGQVPAKG